MDGEVQQPQKSFLPAEILRKAGALDLYKVAVWCLAAVSVLTVLLIGVLAIMSRDVPPELSALGTTALVGLVAMVRGNGQ
jgi:hypothetical protein